MFREVFSETFETHFTAGLRSVARGGSQYSSARAMVD